MSKARLLYWCIDWCIFSLQRGQTTCGQYQCSPSRMSPITSVSLSLWVNLSLFTWKDFSKGWTLNDLSCGLALQSEMSCVTEGESESAASYSDYHFLIQSSCVWDGSMWSTVVCSVPTDQGPNTTLLLLYNSTPPLLRRDGGGQKTLLRLSWTSFLNRNTDIYTTLHEHLFL